MKVLKDFYRSYFKSYGTKEDSWIEANKKRIDSIVDFNKDYNNKTRIICGIIEYLLSYVIVFIVLELYFTNFFNIREWTLQRGIIGLFLFVFSLGIPAMMLMELFNIFFDNCINFLSIKHDKEIIKKRIIPIAILAFIVNFILYMILWFIIYTFILKV